MSGTAKIFGIGLSKTGTTSLHQALLRLGYRSVHYPHDPVTRSQLLRGDFRLQLLDHVDALTDSPIVPFFRSFDRLYPGSRFILTVRDLDSWLDSAERHWARYPLRRPDDPRLPFRLALFGIAHFNREHFADIWRQHHAAVRDYFRGRAQDLLELDLCGGAGWEPLCRFLGHPLPNEPFPHANKGVHRLGASPAAPAPTVVELRPEPAVLPIVQDRSPAAVPLPVVVPSPSQPHRLLFCSYHCLVDPAGRPRLGLPRLLRTAARLRGR
jgi:hypothetical protein